MERDGSGLFQVWNKQIQQLNRVSPAVATAVTVAYPSPQLLLQVNLSEIHDPLELSDQRVVAWILTVTTHCATVAFWINHCKEII